MTNKTRFSATQEHLDGVGKLAAVRVEGSLLGPTGGTSPCCDPTETTRQAGATGTGPGSERAT